MVVAQKTAIAQSGLRNPEAFFPRLRHCQQLRRLPWVRQLRRVRRLPRLRRFVELFHRFWLEKCPCRGFRQQNGWKSALVGVFGPQMGVISPTRGIFQPKLANLLSVERAAMRLAGGLQHQNLASNSEAWGLRRLQRGLRLQMLPGHVIA